MCLWAVRGGGVARLSVHVCVHGKWCCHADKAKVLEVHVYTCRDFEGPAVETYVRVVSQRTTALGEVTWLPRCREEMRPEWFKAEEIPYARMWPDDKCVGGGGGEGSAVSEVNKTRVPLLTTVRAVAQVLAPHCVRWKERSSFLPVQARSKDCAQAEY